MKIHYIYNITRNKIIPTIVLLTFTIEIMAQQAGDIVRVNTADESKYFYTQEIPDNVFSRMQGKSYPKACTIKRSELHYLRILHINKYGETQIGEMVCNKSISNDLIEIFRCLYNAKYPIERMVLIDEYGADDEKSMAANNTTCFNYRLMTGSSTKVSKHGMGLAIDLNPLYNPYVKGKTVQPKGSKNYAWNRNPASYKTSPMGENIGRFIITQYSLPYRLFTKHGFKWGGAWKSLKDYQHFEK